MRIPYCLLLLAFSLGVAGNKGFTQGSADSLRNRQLDFYNYLIGREQYQDAAFILQRELSKPELPPAWSDSLNHLLGWTWYSMKELSKSAECFEKVSPLAPGYAKCRFFAAYNHVYLGDTARGLRLLKELRPETDWQQELIDFQQAGIFLLQRDLAAFKTREARFTGTIYALSQEELRFGDIARRLAAHHDKSMTLAALMSAIIPGTGKIYAGKTGEGISAFLIVAALGLVTWENYRMDGPADVKTILAGSACTVYYIGNIWGSALAAHRRNQQFHHEINQRILFDLHIPLRSIFN